MFLDRAGLRTLCPATPAGAPPGKGTEIGPRRQSAPTPQPHQGPRLCQSQGQELAGRMPRWTGQAVAWLPLPFPPSVMSGQGRGQEGDR